MRGIVISMMASSPRMTLEPGAPVGEQARAGRRHHPALDRRAGQQVAAIERRGAATGFFQDQMTGRVVPQHLAAMNVDIEAAGGDETPFKSYNFV